MVRTILSREILLALLILVPVARAVPDVQWASVPLSPRFVENMNGTVTDTHTGLMWEGKPLTRSVSWSEALSYSDALVLGGHADWRMPSATELEEVTTFLGSRHLVLLQQSASGFGDAKVDYYWSADGYDGSILVCWTAESCDLPGSALVWAVRSTR